VFGDEKVTTALLDRLTHRCHILKTGNDSYRLKDSTTRKGKANSKKAILHAIFWRKGRVNFRCKSRVSFHCKSTSSAEVSSFLGEFEGDSFLSVITLHEVDYGMAHLPDGKRKRETEHWLEVLERQFAEFVQPVARGGRQACRMATSTRARARPCHSSCRHLADAPIAGTAIERGLRLITRNTSDFEGSGVRLVNRCLDAE
jgi:predicted nucleic acid-binding protein